MRAQLSQIEDAPVFSPQGRPARLNGADAALAEQVARWRGQGMSWDAVARALRRSGPDVRAAFDPAYLRAAPAVTAPGAIASPALPQLSEAEARVVVALSRGERAAMRLAEVLGIERVEASRICRTLRGAGLVSGIMTSTSLWELTERGKAAARALTGAAAAGLTPPAQAVLGKIARRAMTPGALAGALDLSIPALKDLLRDLEAAGLAERGTNGGWRPTVAGRAAAREAADRG